MSFGWSVGDLIAGKQIVAKISRALSESKGSANKFKDVVAQLRDFETVLKWVKEYAEECQRRGDEAAKAVFLPIVNAGRDKIDGILDQLDSYQGHLGPASKLDKTRFLDTISKIKFTIFREKEIAGWQSSLTLSTASITIMLIMSQVGVIFAYG